MKNPVARNRHLLAQVRDEVESFAPSNRDQRHLQGLLLSMIRHMEQSCCRLSKRRDFARWWGALECYSQLLTSPVMASSRSRTVLSEVLATPWPKVENACARALRPRRRRKGRKRKPRLRPRRQQP